MIKMSLAILLSLSFIYGKSRDYCGNTNKDRPNHSLHSKVQRWQSFVEKTKNKPEGMYQELNELITEIGFPVVSGRLNKKKYDKDAISLYEAVCGIEKLVFVKQLKDTEILSFDKVYEIDKSGKIIKIWHKPVEALILGIQGEALIIKESVSYLCDDSDYVLKIELQIQPNGRFEARPYVAGPKESQTFDCEELKLLEDSGYRVCSVQYDRKSKKQRKIVYEASCT